jgi:hypothetical protein
VAFGNETLADAVVAYYDQTWLDYRLLWLNPRNLSVHFGYTDATTRDHADALLNMNRELADRAAIGPRDRVLDAGCGVGGSSFWLAEERGERVLHEWLDGWAIPDLDTRAEHLSAIAAAGLAEGRVDDVTAHTRPSLRRLYQITFWTYPLAVLGRAVGIRSAVQHGNVIGALRQYQALERGLWFYGIISAVKR